MHLAVRCAIEYLTLSGARTQSRLTALVEHYATVYGVTGEELEKLQAEATGWATRVVFEFDKEA